MAVNRMKRASNIFLLVVKPKTFMKRKSSESRDTLIRPLNTCLRYWFSSLLLLKTKSFLHFSHSYLAFFLCTLIAKVALEIDVLNHHFRFRSSFFRKKFFGGRPTKLSSSKQFPLFTTFSKWLNNVYYIFPKRNKRERLLDPRKQRGEISEDFIRFSSYTLEAYRRRPQKSQLFTNSIASAWATIPKRW